MAGNYIGGGGGLFGALLRGASTFIPGVNAVAPYLLGGAALLNGDPAGAAGMVGSKLLGDAFERSRATNARNVTNREVLNGSLWDAADNGTGVPAAMPGDASGGAWTRQHRLAGGIPDFNTDPVTGEKQLRKKPWEVGW